MTFELLTLAIHTGHFYFSIFSFEYEQKALLSIFFRSSSEYNHGSFVVHVFGVDIIHKRRK